MPGEKILAATCNFAASKNRAVGVCFAADGVIFLPGPRHNGPVVSPPPLSLLCWYMKLKTPPAPPTSAAAVSHTIDAAAPQRLNSNRRVDLGPLSRSASPDPLASLVRKFVPSRNAATDSVPAAVNGTVIAETKVDGFRYVMVRCAPKPNDALLALSPRERDIVNLITKGYPNKMIAELLDISAWTVGTHLRRIFAKLGVTSRAAMVARYLHHLGD
jgi:DNA-binding NarL/FixJ family response regulator